MLSTDPPAAALSAIWDPHREGCRLTHPASSAHELPIESGDSSENSHLTASSNGIVTELRCGDEECKVMGWDGLDWIGALRDLGPEPQMSCPSITSTNTTCISRYSSNSTTTLASVNRTTMSTDSSPAVSFFTHHLRSDPMGTVMIVTHSPLAQRTTSHPDLPTGIVIAPQQSEIKIGAVWCGYVGLKQLFSL
ncbi:hypothetical protein EX30DRAFT_36170 [Ascodesmis nigricans]|uniref:Uncharacterized protein n=1 Tax=Ascodesmis nigricans TaxID=341454 RepID=A0A4S2MWR1_9PEZI|nr:hypothetical protein EX30DRAFT_36170 [Ascodesmis nigricans]